MDVRNPSWGFAFVSYWYYSLSPFLSAFQSLGSHTNVFPAQKNFAILFFFLQLCFAAPSTGDFRFLFHHLIFFGEIFVIFLQFNVRTCILLHAQFSKLDSILFTGERSVFALLKRRSFENEVFITVAICLLSHFQLGLWVSNPSRCLSCVTVLLIYSLSFSFRTRMKFLYLINNSQRVAFSRGCIADAHFLIMVLFKIVKIVLLGFVRLVCQNRSLQVYK